MPAKGQLKGEWVPCHWCGTLIYKTPYQLKRHKHHYCSNKCQSDERHAATYEDRPCEICGELMHVSKKSTQRFCSMECQRIWQTQQVGELNTRFSRGKIKCDYCQNDFFIKKYKIDNGQRHFCSKECRQAWYANVWSQSEEWKELGKKRAASALKNMKSTTLTKPQIIINNILDSSNISYCNEELFIYYSVDNYLIDCGLIIEVMGDYWHGNPIKFRNLNDMQIKNIIRDKAKHSFLLNNYGVNVLYLWEKDIIENPSLCLLLIKSYIKENGFLENYNSFNYTIFDSKLVLKNELIIPYQDMDSKQIKEHIKVTA